MDAYSPTYFAAMMAFFIASLFFLVLLIIWQIKKYVKTKRLDAETKHQLILTHERKLTTATLASIEKERSRLAADIHDGLISQLRYILLRTEEEETRTIVKDLMIKARNISHDIMPPLIEKLPLDTLITGLLEPLSNPLVTHLTNSGNDYPDLSPMEKLNIYRIVQELISNTLQHAHACTIFLCLRPTKRTFALLYKDDGRGIKGSHSSGLGMKTIETRCNALDAQWKIKSDKRFGFIFILLLKRMVH